MKYHRKTKESVDVLKFLKYSSIESALDFVYGRKYNGIIIHSICCIKEGESENKYAYHLLTNFLKESPIALAWG